MQKRGQRNKTVCFGEKVQKKTLGEKGKTPMQITIIKKARKKNYDR